MTLTEYQQKRKFNQTLEPKGKVTKHKGVPIFVVQKHQASRLHYDFRLEMEGVLKSWAVPKGPSMNPKDKRLAIMVEDHPYEYRNFEGVIPKGNYGAGKVIVWDRGTYQMVAGNLKSGQIKFVLKGRKLKGGFALIKLRGRSGGKAWLLIKERDKFANISDVLKKDRSVISGKTLSVVSSFMS